MHSILHFWLKQGINKRESGGKKLPLSLVLAVEVSSVDQLHEAAHALMHAGHRDDDLVLGSVLCGCGCGCGWEGGCAQV